MYGIFNESNGKIWSWTKLKQSKVVPGKKKIRLKTLPLIRELIARAMTVSSFINYVSVLRTYCILSFIFFNF